VEQKEMVFDNLDYHHRIRLQVVLETLHHPKAAAEQVVDNYEINRSINHERRAPSQDKMLTSAYFWDRSHHNPPAHWLAGVLSSSPHQIGRVRPSARNRHPIRNLRGRGR
jgi:hypothetical protein